MRTIIKLLITLISIFILAGCGNSDDSSSNNDTNETNASTPPSVPPTNNTITFKGLEYKIVTSPKTGVKWLDRNLGASRVCQTPTDTQCFGDYFQFGREADGHEKSYSLVIKSQVAVIKNVGDSFYYGYQDWTTADANGSKRQAYYLKSDGTGICPKGFRLPIDEWNNEYGLIADFVNIVSNGFLKLPTAGYRDVNGTIQQVGTSILFNAIYVVNDPTLGLLVTAAGSGYTNETSVYPSNGYNIRCVEE